MLKKKLGGLLLLVVLLVGMFSGATTAVFADDEWVEVSSVTYASDYGYLTVRVDNIGPWTQLFSPRAHFTMPYPPYEGWARLFPSVELEPGEYYIWTSDYQQTWDETVIRAWMDPDTDCSRIDFWSQVTGGSVYGKTDQEFGTAPSCWEQICSWHNENDSLIVDYGEVFMIRFNNLDVSFCPIKVTPLIYYYHYLEDETPHIAALDTHTVEGGSGRYWYWTPPDVAGDRDVRIYTLDFFNYATDAEGTCWDYCQAGGNYPCKVSADPNSTNHNVEFWVEEESVYECLVSPDNPWVVPSTCGLNND